MAEPPGPVERIFRARAFTRMRRAMVSLPVSTRFTRMHARVIKASGGRIRRSHLFAGAMPVLVLTTTGRRSGQPRSVPIAYVRHGKAFAVATTNGGTMNVPSWWLNLQAQPRAEVLVEGRTSVVTARRADAAEAAELWDEFVRDNPGFDEYRRIADREIPIVLLTPEA